MSKDSHCKSHHRLQCTMYRNLSDFGKRLRNIFGSCRHGPHAIFRKYSKNANRGIVVGFVKPSECQMAGEHIALCRLLRLKSALRATCISQEFNEGGFRRTFIDEISIIESDDFWTYLFSMCRALYAPMRVLRLADQKTPSMDKLHYYVCQTDVNLSKYIEQAETDAKLPRDDRTLTLMNACSENVESESDEDEGDDGEGDEEDSDGNNDKDKGYDVSSSDDDEDADDDDEADDDEDAAEEAAELVIAAEFVNDTIGMGRGQLRQVQQPLISLPFPPLHTEFLLLATQY